MRTHTHARAQTRTLSAHARLQLLPWPLLHLRALLPEPSAPHASGRNMTWVQLEATCPWAPHTLSFCSLGLGVLVGPRLSPGRAVPRGRYCTPRTPRGQGAGSCQEATAPVLGCPRGHSREVPVLPPGQPSPPRPPGPTTAPRHAEGAGLTSDWRPGRPGCWRRGGGAPSGSWSPAALRTAGTRTPGCPGCAGRRTRT